MSAAYDEAQAILNDVIAIESRIMPIVDPAMAQLVTDALNTIKTVLATTFGPPDTAATAAGIDAAARAELDAKFGK